MFKARENYLILNNLFGANLKGAILNHTNLNGADLSGANLFGAQLNGTALDRAILNGASATLTGLMEKHQKDGPVRMPEESTSETLTPEKTDRYFIMHQDTIQIVKAATDRELDQVRQLIKKYAASRNFDAALADLSTELKHLANYYPVILLAYRQERPAGCVAIQVLEEQICEMKRLFVPPDFRGHGVGRSLVTAVIEAARALGFQSMRLDTHPNMHQAQKLYRHFGFTEIERYNQNPIPGIRFFELRLDAGV